MTYWLYPANTKYYDLFAAFSKKATYWPMKSKVAAGDKVLFYIASPYKQIGYETEVEEIDLPQDEIFDRISPFIKNIPENGKNKAPFMKLTKIVRIELSSESPFRLSCLRHAGLKGMLMGPRNLQNNPQLLSYITGKLSELPTYSPPKVR